MQDEGIDTAAIDMDAIRAEARTEGYANAREIVELCALAGLPGNATELLAKNATAPEARQFLMEARAAADPEEIHSHVLPDTGTSVKAKPEDSPVMKAVERLAGKAVN
jgi:hypothetical protein